MTLRYHPGVAPHHPSATPWRVLRRRARRIGAEDHVLRPSCRISSNISAAWRSQMPTYVLVFLASGAVVVLAGTAPGSITVREKKRITTTPRLEESMDLEAFSTRDPKPVSGSATGSARWSDTQCRR